MQDARENISANYLSMKSQSGIIKANHGTILTEHTFQSGDDRGFLTSSNWNYAIVFTVLLAQIKYHNIEIN